MKFILYIICIVIFFCFAGCGACIPENETLSTESAVATMEQPTKNTTEHTTVTETSDILSKEEGTYTESDVEIDFYQDVDQSLLELCESEEYINSAYDEKVELVLSVLEELESQNHIVKGSIVYYENQEHITFKYINGALGEFDFKVFGDKYN